MSAKSKTVIITAKKVKEDCARLEQPWSHQLAVPKIEGGFTGGDGQGWGLRPRLTFRSPVVGRGDALELLLASRVPSGQEGRRHSPGALGDPNSPPDTARGEIGPKARRTTSSPSSKLKYRHNIRTK